MWLGASLKRHAKESPAEHIPTMLDMCVNWLRVLGTAELAQIDQLSLSRFLSGMMCL